MHSRKRILLSGALALVAQVVIGRYVLDDLIFWPLLTVAEQSLGYVGARICLAAAAIASEVLLTLAIDHFLDHDRQAGPIAVQPSRPMPTLRWYAILMASLFLVTLLVCFVVVMSNIPNAQGIVAIFMAASLGAMFLLVQVKQSHKRTPSTRALRSPARFGLKPDLGLTPAQIESETEV